MNRKQAESILKAYVSMIYARDAGGGSDTGNAVNALREVILDAMCNVETRFYPVYQSAHVNAPSIEPYKPIVTWTTETASTRDEVVS